MKILTPSNQEHYILPSWGCRPLSRVGDNFRWIVASFQTPSGSASYCKYISIYISPVVLSGSLFLFFFPETLPKSKAEPTSDAAAVNTWHPPHSFYFCTDID